MSWPSICRSCPPAASVDLLSAPLGFGVDTPPGPSESKNRFLRSEGCDARAGAGRVSFSLRSYHCLRQHRSSHSICLAYLYAGVLRSKVHGAVEGRVCDAEDVADVVGRPKGVEVSEGRCAPDLAYC
jgi:hypothetical protein